MILSSPIISIIVPFYNAEKYLDRCIRSILSQTYKDYEIVLVNDGSSDGSLRICQEYANENNNISLVSQDNSGVSAARNRGLSVAKGEYVMFVDSDDYMLPQMCEIMVDAVEEKNADLVVCGTTETWGGVWAPNRDVDYSSLASFKSDFIEHLTSELLSPPWNKIYRRELIKDVFETSSSFGEDLMFNLQYLAKIQAISVVDMIPYYYVIDNPTSITGGKGLYR
jgi:glycosyltransferase involved in cell wall biosynthesis